MEWVSLSYYFTQDFQAHKRIVLKPCFFREEVVQLLQAIIYLIIPSVGRAKPQGQRPLSSEVLAEIKTKHLRAEHQWEKDIAGHATIYVLVYAEVHLSDI